MSRDETNERADPVVTGESAPCWCGLPAEKHDGRELDANDELHQFGQPVRPPRRDPEAQQSKLPRLSDRLGVNPRVLQVLLRARRFLDNEIVAQAHNGLKIPGSLVNNASQLSREIAQILE